MPVTFASLSRLILPAALSVMLQIFWPAPASAQQPVSRTLKYTRGTANDAGFWQHELRTRLFSALQLDDLMQNRDKTAFNAKIIRSENKGAYELREVEINTTPTRRMRVILTLPTGGKGPFPAVVAIHGHGGKPESVYTIKGPYRGFAHELATRNYITIAPFVSQHNVHEENRLLMGERLFDCIRSIDYLESLPEVNKNQIGAAGLSLGGEMTMWLGAMDRRVKVSVVSGFLTKMGQLEQDHCMCWKFPGLRELADFSDIYGLIAPRPLLFQIGRKEPASQFPLDLAREAFIDIQQVYNDFAVPEQVLLVAHDAGHEVEVPVLVNFMTKYLAATPLPY